MKTFYILLESVIAVCILGFAAAAANATVIQSVSGLSATGDAVNFKSQLTISGDILTVELFNISPVASNSPDDLLSSYFFDIKNNVNRRPMLNYLTAFGDVYLVDKTKTDALQKANADIKAVKKNDNSWEFLPLNPAYSPFLGFGIGAVGNSDMGPNNFNGNLVHGIDYAIYTGEVTTQSLSNKLFVKSSAVFRFSGLTGFTEADIANLGVFGLGTSPDTLLTFSYTKPPDVPEPATIILFCLGGLILMRRKKR